MWDKISVAELFIFYTFYCNTWDKIFVAEPEMFYTVVAVTCPEQQSFSMIAT